MYRAHRDRTDLNLGKGEVLLPYSPDLTLGSFGPTGKFNGKPSFKMKNFIIARDAALKENLFNESGNETVTGLHRNSSIEDQTVPPEISKRGTEMNLAD